MATTLIRGRYVVTDADAPALEHGAVLVDGERVVAVGKASDLAARAPGARVLGSDNHMVIPGLVNSHCHGRGIGTFQMGALDDQLELWIHDRRPHRVPNVHLDTLLATINMVESGVTSALNSHTTRSPRTWEAEMDQALAAYDASGMRVAFAPGLRWQCNYVYEDDAAFAATLPQPLRGRFEQLIGQTAPVRLDRYLAGFDALAKRIGMRGARHRLLHGPVSLQWIGDEDMRAIARLVQEQDTGLHVHVQESPYQFEWGPRTYGHSVVKQLHVLGALTPRTTLGHCVWLSEDDIDLMAGVGASYAHNPSANLRLKSGISPVIRARDRGLNVGLGTDSMTINDDDDYMQEMRLAAKLHRLPGSFERDLSSRDVLRMATKNGRKVVLFDDVGTLAPGGPADLVVLRLDGMLDDTLQAPGFDPVDLLLYRGRKEHVDAVLVAGEMLMENGQLTRVNKRQVLDELRADAEQARHENPELRALTDELRPYIVQYYDPWFRERYAPHYTYNARG